MTQELKMQYRSEIAIIEEFNDSDMDGWITERETFDNLFDAIVYADTGMMPDEYSRIYLEIFDPSINDWKTLLSFGTEAAKQIEVESDD